MSLVCVRCRRPITTAAFQLATRGRPLLFGPVCARKAGLIERKERPRATASRAPDHYIDPAQMQLELTCTQAI